MSDFARGKRIRFRDLQSWLKIWLCCGAVLLPLLIFASGEPLPGASLTIAELEKMVCERGRAIQSFRIEGWVRAVIQEQQTTIVLEDSSGAAAFEMPLMQDSVRAGERAEIAAENCLLVRTHFGIRVGTAPTVKNEGLKLPAYMSGSVFLEAGLQPIRLEWDPRPNDSVLDLVYEGPDIPRQKIPSGVLCRKVADIGGENSLQPGLDFSIKLYSNELSLPSGVVTNFNISSRLPSNGAGLFANGYMKVAHAGVYIFHLKSSGSCALWVGEPAVHCSRVDVRGRIMPSPETLNRESASRNTHQWLEIEGEVAFAGISERRLEIELVEAGTQDHIAITIDKAEALSRVELIHRHIRVAGIGEFSHKRFVSMVVPCVNQVQVIGSTKEVVKTYSTNDLLTTAAQVRHLKPDQASLRLPVKIQGVLIAAFVEALVVQDSTGGVYARINPADFASKPAIGELWEIEGTTDPGEFSPVVFASKGKYLGQSALPAPAHPTWDQLMNGNLDAEYVELRGVLCALSATQLTLLMPEGKVTASGNEWFALRRMPPSLANGAALIGSLVRVRGCFITKWNMQTREVIGGVFDLEPGVMDVDEPAPLDPFSLPRKKVADLLWFDAVPSAFQRTKVVGQVVYARPGEYFLLDQQIGARILTAQPVSLRIGDVVEAVGFPKLGGPSPILLESQVRKIDHASLPVPKEIVATALLDGRHDSTLVRVTAVLVNEIVHKDELILEMQAGPVHFAARLKTRPETWPTLSVGSVLGLTGVYASADKNRANDGLGPFELLLEDPFGITELQRPSWWTVRHSVTVVASLGGTLGIAFVWITLLQRIVKKRTAQLQKTEHFRVMEQERIRIARDLHDELGAGLTEVGMLGALTANPAVPLKDKEHYLGQLSESTRSLVTKLDEIVWAINPQYDSVGSLVTYYSLFAQRFLNLAGIACRLQVVEPFPECPFDSRLRHGVFLAFKEALNNVVRHSEAKETEIKMEVASNQLTISIRDNGRGVASGAAPGQDGLVGMRDRLRQLGGECQITSQPTGGTIVEFRIPLRQSNYD